jgi:AcrR family transcriptional regulator
MTRTDHGHETRRDILRAALKRFAHSGYAAASVQQIVDDAGVSKPALYYHFRDKAGLFQALVHESLDREYEVLRAAEGRAQDVRGRLVAILAALFDYFRGNRELVRIALATMFASPGELPVRVHYIDRCERNFEFVHGLIRRALRSGELESRFSSRELAFGFYGQANVHMMAHLLLPKRGLDRQTAARIVDLFLAGAAAKR